MAAAVVPERAQAENEGADSAPPQAPSPGRRLRHIGEALMVRIGLALFARLSIDRASALGGALGRLIGPRLSVSRQAEHNLARAFPDRPAGQITALVRAMWDNLGRVAAEHPHLSEIGLAAPEGRVEVVGGEHIAGLRDHRRGGIIFAAHLANWEILPLVAAQFGLPLTQAYRAANNPRVEQLLQASRGADHGRYVAKGAGAAREMLATLKAGGHIAMLVDQKMNDGIPVAFFGRPAMTAPALAQLALRFDCPIVPARLERLDGARFRLTLLAPLARRDSGDAVADVAEIMHRVNALVEQWIRECPAQWLWLHRRWPD